MLDIDFSLWPLGTLWIQVANFLLLLLLMNIFLYRPIRRVLAQRNNETNSLQKMIEDYQNRSEQDEKDIKEGMFLARKEGFVEKESLKDQGLEEERVVLQEAGSSVETKKEGAKKEIEMKMSEVREALDDEIAGFSRDLAEKLLGRSLQ